MDPRLGLPRALAALSREQKRERPLERKTPLFSSTQAIRTVLADPNADSPLNCDAGNLRGTPAPTKPSRDYFKQRGQFLCSRFFEERPRACRVRPTLITSLRLRAGETAAFDAEAKSWVDKHARGSMPDAATATESLADSKVPSAGAFGSLGYLVLLPVLICLLLMLVPLGES